MWINLETRVKLLFNFYVVTVPQNEQLEQTDTFPYLESLITEDGECTTEFRTRLNRGRLSGHHCRKYGKVTAYRFQRRHD